MEEIVELLNAGQYVKLRQLIAGYNVADIAAYMEKLEQDEVLKLFRWDCVVLGVLLLTATRWAPKVRDLHPIWFILGSAVAGVVFRFGGV